MAGGMSALGGACEVVIYKDGQTITRDNFSPFFNSISRITAKVETELMAQITIELTPTFDDALMIMAKGILGSSTGTAGQGFSAVGAGKKSVTAMDFSTPVVSPSSAVSQKGQSNAPYYAVKFFYPGEDDTDTDWYGGLAVVPEITLDNGEITIKVKITGSHALMAVNQGPKVYNNESAYDVITKLAKTFNCQIAFPDGDTETETTLRTAMIKGQYNENSENIIRRILMRLRLKYVKDSGGSPPQTRYLISSVKRIHEQDIAYEFVVLRQVEPESNVIPLQSFSLLSPGTLFNPGHTFGSFSTAVLSSSKQIKTRATTATSNQALSTSAIKAETGAFPLDNGDGSAKGGSVGKTNDSDPDEAGAHQPAVGNKEFDTTEILEARSEIARSEYLKFRGGTYGLPRIQPLQMVQLTVGPGEDGIEAFSGPCCVNSIEHDWSNSEGWVTSMELTKTGGAASIYSIDHKASQASKPADNRVAKTPKAF